MAIHPHRLRLVFLAVLDTMVHPVADLAPTLAKIIYIILTLTLTTHRPHMLRTFLTFPCILHNLRPLMPLNITKSIPLKHNKLRILRHILLLLLSLMQPITRVGLFSSRYPRYQNNCPCRPLPPCHP